MISGVKSCLGAALGIPSTRPRPNRGPANCRFRLTYDVTRPKRIITPTNCAYRTADVGAARTAGRLPPRGRRDRSCVVLERRAAAHGVTGNQVLPPPVAEVREVEPCWRPLPDWNVRMPASHARAPVASAAARPNIQDLSLVQLAAALPLPRRWPLRFSTSGVMTKWGPRVRSQGLGRAARAGTSTTRVGASGGGGGGYQRRVYYTKWAARRR